MSNEKAVQPLSAKGAAFARNEVGMRNDYAHRWHEDFDNAAPGLDAIASGAHQVIDLATTVAVSREEWEAQAKQRAALIRVVNLVSRGLTSGSIKSKPVFSMSVSAEKADVKPLIQVIEDDLRAAGFVIDSARAQGEKA